MEQPERPLLEKEERTIEDVLGRGGLSDTHRPGRYASDDSERRYISRDYRTGGDHTTLSQSDARENHRARANPDVVLNQYTSMLDVEVGVIDAV